MPKDASQPPRESKPITATYGKRLKEFREQQKFSQQGAAEAMGVSLPTYAKCESGERQPTYDELRNLTRLYGCKLSDLMPANNYPSAPLDPKARREHFNKRNAAIAGLDEETYLATIEEQRQRRESYIDRQQKAQANG